MTKIVQIITSLVLACGSLFAHGEEIPLRPQHPDRHVVVKGDTLWDISAKFLKNPWQWPQIWQLNREHIKNPHWIYPGDVIVLDTSSGKPVLRLMRESITLEPGVIVSPIKAEAIPAIQPNVILAFLNKPMLITTEELNAAPRIVAAQEERQILSPGTHIYVKNLPANPHQFWAIYREGEPVKDPETNQVLGLEAHYLGEAKLLRSGETATLNITQAKEEIAVKDKLAEMTDDLSQTFIPHAPEKRIRGQIARISDGIVETGTGRVVVLNRGENDGLENGHVLAILRKGASMTDPESDPKHPQTIQLPDEPMGLLMVFKTFPHLSYALVMQVSQPVHVEDVVQTP